MEETEKSLQTLVNDASRLELMLIESGGEVTAEIEALLAVPDFKLPQKIDGYALVMDRMAGIQDFYKAKADMYLRLAKSADGVATRCKDNLKFAMETLGQDEICGFDVKFKLVKSNPSCVIDDEKSIEPAYKIQEIITKIDKKRMTDDMKLGVPVQGAHLEQGVSLRQYINNANRKNNK